jgi:hypothetical protein
MPEVRILSRVEFNDLSKGMPGIPSVMVTFQLPDWRVGSVIIPKSAFSPEAEKRAIAEEIKKMARPIGETITV